ncbi:MAG: hypothetical protein ABIP53_01610 [Candidatus Limnocylindrales bacterium]
MRARLDPHSKYRELLAARLDRPLIRAQTRVLVAHLKTCAECRQAERDYLDQRSLLRSLPPMMPPRDMWARTSTALDREVSRWSYRYPRFGRKAIVPGLGDGRPRSGAPSALATAVAALGIVTVMAVLQLAPSLRPTPLVTDDGAVATRIRPTPFAVAPQPLTFVAAGINDFAIYETQVNQVCPAGAYDCFDDEGIVRRSVSLTSNIHPQNVALSPDGEQIAVVSKSSDRDVIAVVMLGNRVDPDPGRPTDRPAPTGANPSSTGSGSSASPSASPDVRTTASARIIDSSRTPAPTNDSSAIPASETPPTTPADSLEPDETPDGQASPDAPVDESPHASVDESPDPTALASPPASVVPGLTVLSILEDVHSAGAPPAWSRDGSVLAFSAMPADSGHGPDVYVWRPGDGQAQAITTDHASYFASWSGRRIVLSRLNQDAGKSESAQVMTVVVDPQSLEERVVDGPEMWLPVVDPQRSHAIVWSGKVSRNGVLPTLGAGTLYLVDWATLNPFREAAPEEPSDPVAEPPQTGDPVKLQPIDPGRDAAANPVTDWMVRWSTDGRVVGIWEAEVANETWGQLALLAFDRTSGRLDLQHPLIDRQLAQRGFTLGVDRVAWVGAQEQGGTGGELRIRTWGDDGVGGLRIKSGDLEELVPSF